MYAEIVMITDPDVGDEIEVSCAVCGTPLVSVTRKNDFNLGQLHNLVFLHRLSHCPAVCRDGRPVLGKGGMPPISTIPGEAPQPGRH